MTFIGQNEVFVNAYSIFCFPIFPPVLESFKSVTPDTSISVLTDFPKGMLELFPCRTWGRENDAKDVEWKETHLN